MKRYSKDYVTTLPNNAEGLAQFAVLVKMLKIVRDNGGDKRLYLAKAPRLGKDNPNSFKYRRGARARVECWGSHNYQMISMKDGATFDVYIRRNYAKSAV